ncbi:MAG TPA: ChaN family lipoprotein [Candidatus Limnocylindrales bacterium]|nr:ChaN family lipoprotein [Candidatus Limnocylindrales bacterium]
MIAIAALFGATSCSTSASQRTWVSPVARDHVLVGQIFDVARGRMVPRKTLIEAAISADFVLLGEQHDNADHHRLQAGIITDLVASGRRPAVAFEQLDLENQAAVDRALADSAGAPPAAQASATAAAVAWDKSGWPRFDLYRPIFETALAARLPILAANLSRAKLHAMFSDPHALDPADPALVPLPDVARHSMAAEVEESHCGYAQPAMVSMMIEAQRRRDAEMAAALARGFEASAARVRGYEEPAAHASGTTSPVVRPGAVLVCGFAHARKDSGVPLTLRQKQPDRRIVSVAFVEVMPDATSPADYAAAFHAATLPFDFVLFTPRTDDTDPCEKYRSELEKMKRH